MQSQYWHGFRAANQQILSAGEQMGDVALMPLYWRWSVS
jgi:hypothetical protein